MSYMPTLSGWSAIALPIVSGFLFLIMLPTRYVQSGYGVYIKEPIPYSVWAFGAITAIISLSACIASFRRGNRCDRVAALVGSFVTLWLLKEYLGLNLVPVRQVPFGM
jgi:hypothetical protein